MNEEIKIKKVLKKGRLSKTEISIQTGIHHYLIDTFLDNLEKKKIIKKEKNKSGKRTYYSLK
jgi:hypothetical protein